MNSITQIIQAFGVCEAIKMLRDAMENEVGHPLSSRRTPQTTLSSYASVQLDVLYVKLHLLERSTLREVTPECLIDDPDEE